MFYIGKGTASRPFLWSNRNATWRAASAGRDIDVTILGWFETEEEALAVERRAIGRLRPSCNMHHNADNVRPAGVRSAIAAGRTGKAHTETTKAEISRKRRDAVARGVVCRKVPEPFVTSDGREFTSVLEASRILRIGRASISRCLHGKAKTAGRLTFTYRSKEVPHGG